MVKTDDGRSEGHQTRHSQETNDYKGGDYEANGADYNIFLSPISKTDRQQTKHSVGAHDSEGSDYNIFLRKDSKVIKVNFHSIMVTLLKPQHIYCVQ